MPQSRSPMAVPGYAQAAFNHALAKPAGCALEFDNRAQAYNQMQRLYAARNQHRRFTPNQAHPWDAIQITMREVGDKWYVFLRRHALPEGVRLLDLETMEQIPIPEAQATTSPEHIIKSYQPSLEELLDDARSTDEEIEKLIQFLPAQDRDEARAKAKANREAALTDPRVKAALADPLANMPTANEKD